MISQERLAEYVPQGKIVTNNQVPTFFSSMRATDASRVIVLHHAEGMAVLVYLQSDPIAKKEARAELKAATQWHTRKRQKKGKRGKKGLVRIEIPCGEISVPE